MQNLSWSAERGMSDGSGVVFDLPRSPLNTEKSWQNKLSNKMFFEEFPTLVSEYSHARRDLAFIGDFNFHFEDSSSGDVDQLTVERPGPASARGHADAQARPCLGLGHSAP